MYGVWQDKKYKSVAQKALKLFKNVCEFEKGTNSLV
jgi:hypothetical protein